MNKFLLLIPGAGPYLAAGWTFLSSPIGRLLIVGAVAFVGGWQAKAYLDEAATARAVIAKQRIDLKAAKDTAEQAAKTVATLSDADAKNQEIIDGLKSKLAERPAVAPASPGCPAHPVCSRALGDDGARSLRRLR